MLTVMEFSHTRNGKSYWKVKCDCGIEKVMRGDSIKNPKVKSCGCYNKSKDRSTHNQTNTKLYRIWASMKQRCTNTNNSHYRYYGGRGITYDKQWENFEPFYEWATTTGYKQGLEIDRIDNDGDYEPSNCRWVTRKEQCVNTSSNRWLTYNGETKTISQWAEYFGVKYMDIYNKLTYWNNDVEKVLNDISSKV